MFLLDTDVLSALRRRERNPEIVRWIEGQRTADLYISVVKVGEIERGIAQHWLHNPTFARDLGQWLDWVLGWYGDRVLLVDPKPQAGGASCRQRSDTTEPICSSPLQR